MSARKMFPLLCGFIFGLSLSACRQDSDTHADAAAKDATTDDASNSDAAPRDASQSEDAMALDASADVPLMFEIVNTGTTSVFLDGSFNHDCRPPYFQMRRKNDTAILVDRPPFLSCVCERCATSSACQGIADAGPAYLEIPAQGVARIPWRRVFYTLGQSPECVSGCLQSMPAEDVQYEIRVEYTRQPFDCPYGTPLVADIRAPEGDAVLYSCEFIGDARRCLVNAGHFSQNISAEFSLADELVSINLP